MHSVVLTRNGAARVRQRLLQFVAYYRTNFRAIATTAAMVVVISELGGIWHEVRQMRNEQVKNATYALSQERRAALHGPGARVLESTAYVSGDVSIDGTVQVEVGQPVQVEIDN